MSDWDVVGEKPLGQPDKKKDDPWAVVEESPINNPAPSVMSAAGKNPASVAAADKLARQYKLPTDVVERNMADVQRQQKVDKANSVTPKLAAWLTDPINAAVSQDDWDVLDTMGKAFLFNPVTAPAYLAFTSNPGRAASASYAKMFGGSIEGLSELPMKQLREQQRMASGLAGLFSKEWEDKINERYDQVYNDYSWILPQEWIKQGGAALGGTINTAADAIDVPQDQRTWLDEIASGLGSAGAFLTVGYATGGLGVGVMGAGVGVDQQADAARQNGLYGTAEGDLAMNIGGAISGLSESIGFKWLTRAIPEPAKKYLSNRIVDIILSGGGEAAQEFIENTSHNITTQQLLDSDQAWLGGVGEASSIGFVVGSLMRGGVHVMAKAEDSRSAVAENETLRKIMEVSQTSKLFQLSPERYKDAVSKLKTAGMEDVYVPVQAWQTLFQSTQESQDARQAAGVSDEEFVSALLSGGRVRVPIEGFLTDFTPEQQAALAENARFRPDGVLPEDAKVFDPRQAMQEYLTSSGVRPAGRDNEVFNDYVARLTGPYSRQEAEAYAETIAAFVRGYGGRTEMVDEIINVLIERTGLKADSKLPKGVQQILSTRKDVVPAIDSILDMLRTKQFPSDREMYGPTLLEAVRSWGGIDPTSFGATDLAKMDAQKQNLFRSSEIGGLTMEDALARAVAEGYIGKADLADSDTYNANAAKINDLIEALTSDLQGVKPVYSPQNANMARQDLTRAADEIDAVLREKGINLDETDNATARRALGWFNDQQEGGQELEQAYGRSSLGRVISVANYYETPGARDLARRVKSNDPQAIKQMAEEMAAIIPAGATLVPMPSRTGAATNTLELAKQIAAITGGNVQDILQGVPRESLFDAKKNGRAVEIEYTIKGDAPKGEVYVIDNVVATGKTAEAATKAIPGAIIAAHSIDYGAFNQDPSILAQPEAGAINFGQVKEDHPEYGTTSYLSTEEPKKRKSAKGAADNAGQPDLFVAEGTKQPNLLQKTKLTQTGEFRSGIKKVKTLDDAAHIFAPLRKMPQEQFMVLALDANGKPLAVLRHTIGTKNESMVDPAAVFGGIAMIEGVDSVVFGHNHPSGVLSPSSADYNLDAVLNRMMDGSGIAVRGAIIVAPSQSQYTAYQGSSAQPRKVKPAVRSGSVPIVERAFKKLLPAKRENIDNPISAKRIAKDAIDRDGNGLILLDNRHNIVGYMPIDPVAAETLRTGNQQTSLVPVMRAIAGANASNVIIYGEKEAPGLRNLSTAISSTQVGVLDIIVKDPKGDMMSYAEWGLDMKTPSRTFLQSERIDDADYRVLRRDFDALQPAEQAVFDEFIAERPDGQDLLARLTEHKGTPWAKQAIEGVFVRKAIQAYAEGRQPEFQSMFDHKAATKVRELVKKQGMEGIQTYLDATGFVGDASKPINNVSSTFINCNPSKDCAKYCYATEGHYRYAPSVIKSELVSLAVEADPVRAAARTAAEYKATAEFANNKALRLFDKGDGNMAWIPYIKALNDNGVRVHIFSKVPAFLRAVPDMNLKLLSIDNSNMEMADQNPDLPVAFVYGGGQAQVDFLAKLAARGQIQVVLPIKLGRKVFDNQQTKELKAAVKGIGKYICPIDGGIKKIGPNSDEKGWNCTKCDKNGGLGCYFGKVTETVLKSGDVKPATPQVKAQRILDLRREINDLTRGPQDNAGAGGDLANAGRTQSERVSQLLLEVDGLLGELLRQYEPDAETRAAIDGDGGAASQDQGVQGDQRDAGRVIPSTTLFQGWYRSELIGNIASLQQIAAKDGSASADQVKAWVAKRIQEGKFKKAEVEAIGLNEYLNTQGLRVSVADVQAFVEQNGVQVKETMLGEQGSTGNVQAAFAREGYHVEFDPLDPSGSSIFFDTNMEEIDFEDLPESLQQVIEQNTTATGEQPEADTKHGSYQLPGGNNYRELLLTLPANDKRTFSGTVNMPELGAAKELIGDISKEQTESFKYKIIEDAGGNVSIQFEGWDQEEYIALVAQARQYGGNVKTVNESGSSDVYRSSHWDQQNVLAHIRFNERTVPGDGPYEVIVRDAGKTKGRAGSTTKTFATLAEANAFIDVKKAGGFNTELKNLGVKRVLFIEEIQSDWAQDGRKKGFAGNRDLKEITKAELLPILAGLTKPTAEEIAGNYTANYAGSADAIIELIRGTNTGEYQDYTIRDSIGLLPDVLVMDYNWTEQAANELATKLRDYGAIKGVPTAPFVTDTNAWVQLSLKRMIAYAVENGFDKVAFVNGEQSADRYDLSKKVDRIDWLIGPTGEKFITIVPPNGSAWTVVTDKDGGVIGNKTNLPMDTRNKSLDDIIGKDLAERILSDEMGSLSGDGLKVGGEGMKAFYDKIVPQNVRAVLKKLGGGEMGQVSIDIQGSPETGTGLQVEREWRGPELTADSVRAASRNESLPSAVQGQLRDIAIAMKAGEDVQRAVTWFGSDAAAKALGGELVAKPNKYVGQPGFDITDAMREAVDAGLPLFQRKRSLQPRGSLTITDKREFIIQLGKARDWSTFLHESGHLYLEVMREVDANLRDMDPASLSDSQRKVLADHDIILKTLGVTAFDQIGREQHEIFAETYEAYLREGKAPSARLQSAFQKFGTWLKLIYRTLAGLPNQKLAPDIVDVFDRMLATDAEIDQAAKDQGLTPKFQDAASAGMTEEEYQRYLEAIDLARRSATDDEMRRQYAYTKQETQAWYRAELARVEADVAAEVNASPVYQAISQLRTGTMPDGSPLPDGRQPVKLNTQALFDEYGRAFVQKHFFGMHNNEGMAPSVVAPALGFASGQDMVEQISNAQPRAAYIKAEARRRMEELHPDPMNDPDAAQKAAAAANNDATEQVLIRELIALGGNRDMARVMKDVAKRVVAGTRIRDLNPNQYRVAQQRAGREAIKSIAAGSKAEGLKALREQMMAGYMLKEATAALEASEKTRELAQRLAKKPAQERLAKAGDDYLANVNLLLGAFEFRRVSNKDLKRREGLRRWVEAAQEAGDVTAISDEILARVEAERTTNFRDATPRQLAELDDALKNLNHLAGLKNKLLSARDKADYEEAVAAMIERIQATNPKILADVVDEYDMTTGQRVRGKLTKLADELTRPESVIEALDGGESGPFHDYIWWPQEQSEAKVNALQGRLGKLLKDLHAALPGDFWSNADKDVTIRTQAGTATMKRYTLMSAVLNKGNETSRQRLRDGGITTASGKQVLFTDEEIDALPGLLTTAELKYIQGLWDVAGAMRDDIEQLTQDMAGVPVQFVESRPFEIQAVDGTTVQMRGGYWPLVYHSDRSSVGDRQAGDDALKIMMGMGFTRAATSKGYTKTRVEELKAPLRLNLGYVLAKNLSDVMTDVAYRKTVRDVQRLLKDPRIKSEIVARMGEGAYRAINGGLAYSVSANGDGVEMTARNWGGMADFLMSNGSVSILAIRPDIALGNYGSSLVQGLTRVDKLALWRGMRALYLSRGDMTAEIKALSPFMANRLDDIDGEYRKELTRSQNKSGFRAAYARVMMTLHRAADHDATRALWWGRYTQERAKGADQDEAIRLADKTIRQTQTTSGRKDLSIFERDTQFKQSRQFMGPMMVIFGQIRQALTGKGIAADGPGAQISLGLNALFFAPAVFALMAGRWPDDDDEDDLDTGDWARWIATNTGVLFFMQTMPILRETASAVEAFVTDRPINPRAAPTAQAAAQMVKSTKSLWRQAEGAIEGDDIEYDKLTADLVSLSAPLTALPASQVKRTQKALAWIEENPEATAAEMAKVMVYGPPK